jgi:hypothetical protein
MRARDLARQFFFFIEKRHGKQRSANHGILDCEQSTTRPRSVEAKTFRAPRYNEQTETRFSIETANTARSVDVGQSPTKSRRRFGTRTGHVFRSAAAVSPYYRCT